MKCKTDLKNLAVKKISITRLHSHFDQAVIEEPCSPPPILEEIAFGLELPPPAIRSSSSSSSGSYDLKDAMVDPNHEIEQVATPSGHTSETELDRDVSAQKYMLRNE